MSKAQTILNRILNAKGGHVSIQYQTFPKPAAQFKGHELKKVTTGAVIAGKDFANLQSVKDAIASGERGEVQPRPYGTWTNFPYIAEHTDKKGVYNEYLRLYPATGGAIQRTTTEYFVDGVPTDKDSFMSMLTPSDRNKSQTPREMWEIKLSGLLGCKIDGEWVMI